MRSQAKLIASALITALALPAQAEQVVCHLNYGGQEQSVIAQPSDSPYNIKPTSIGSYFLFRITFRTAPPELAGIKLYTYVDHANGPALIHQASYPYPVAKAFTGTQRIYEPVRDSELEYHCELQTGVAK